MGRRDDSDEHYVLDLCDEVIGVRCERQAMFPWLVGAVSPTAGRARGLPVDGYCLRWGSWSRSRRSSTLRPSRRATAARPSLGCLVASSGDCTTSGRRRFCRRDGIHAVVIQRSESTTKADEIVCDHDCDAEVVRAGLARPPETCTRLARRG